LNLYLVKRGGALWAHDEEAARVVKSWGNGEVLRVKISRPRNAKHHNKAMALLRLLFENQDKHLEFNNFRTEVKIRLGCYDEFITADGKLVYVPWSLDFASMDQDTFAEEFYKPLTRLALRDFMPPGFTEEQLETEMARRALEFQ
jgi:hypothetical protein